MQNMATRSKQPSWIAAEKRRAKREEMQRDLEALNDIHSLLDGTEWGSDTLEQIADILRETGREIREPDYGLHE